jgi:NitT/TauT family transport system substrate-binding protein
MRTAGRRAALIGFVLAFAVSGLAACGGDEDATGSNEQTTVRIGTPLWIGVAPLVIADQKGFDTDNGIDLRVQVLEELKDLTSSIGAGRLDGGYGVGPGQALTMMAADIKTRHVLLGDVSLGGDQIVGKSQITSVGDLRGKKVGIETASTGYPMLVYALESNGLTLDDINRVELSGASAPVALNAGRVDAAYTWEPYISTALKKGFRTIYEAGNKPGIISDFLVVRESFAEDNEDAVVALLKTWQAGVEHLRSDREDAYKAVADGMNIPLKDVRVGLDPTKLKPTDLQESLDFFEETWPTLSSVFVEIVNGSSDIPRKVTVEEATEAVDTSYAEQALEDTSS